MDMYSKNTSYYIPTETLEGRQCKINLTLPAIPIKLYLVCDTGLRYAEGLIPWCVVVAATLGTLCFVGTAAVRATLRLVGKAFTMEELLFPSGESERGSTIGTLE